MYIDKDYILARVKLEDLKAVTRGKDDPDEVNELKVQSAILDASADFDRAASQAGYVTPVTSPNNYIKRVVFDIAVYYLYAGKYDDDEMKDVYVRYNIAFEKLNLIAKGEIKIPGAEELVTFTSNSVIQTNKTLDDRKFSRLGAL